MTKMNWTKAGRFDADPGAVTSLTDYDSPPKGEHLISGRALGPEKTKALYARSDALWRKAIAKKRAAVLGAKPVIEKTKK